MSGELIDAQVAYEIGFADGLKGHWKRAGEFPDYTHDYLKGYEDGVLDRTKRDKAMRGLWINND